jgi:hypothetical protein
MASCLVMAIMPALDVVCASDPRFLKLNEAFSDAVFTTTVTGFQMRSRGAREVKDKINFVAPVTVPLLIGDIFNPIEVGPGGVVEQHIDAVVSFHREINEGLAIAWGAEIARLEDRDGSARLADGLYGLIGITDALTSRRQSPPRARMRRPPPSQCSRSSP